MTTSAWWGEDIVPRIRWRIEIREGNEIPDGYGLDYRRVATRMPLPLNLIVGLWRAVAWWNQGYESAEADCRMPSTWPRRHNPYRCDHCRESR